MNKKLKKSNFLKIFLKKSEQMGAKNRIYNRNFFKRGGKTDVQMTKFGKKLKSFFQKGIDIVLYL